MKPIYLKMIAFGPYPEKVELNFEKDLIEDIFVVTGPTGAGKTTIFDAICYALYGDTSGKKRSINEIRSHFVGIDSPLTEVEFIFEVGGNRYYIKRRPAQMRKVKRGSGETKEDAYVELKDISNAKISLTKDKEVKEEIESIVGLTLDQFRKIVMIPQGDFREFLDSNTEDKTKILRKIFGTNFYQKVQDKLSENTKELHSQISDIEKSIKIKSETIKRKTDSQLNILIQNDASTQELIEALKNHIIKEEEEKQTQEVNQNKVEEMYKEKEQQYNNGININKKFKDREDKLQELKELEHRQNYIDEMKRKYSSGSKAIEIIDTELYLLQEQKELENLVIEKGNCEKYLENINIKYKDIEVEYNKIEVATSVLKERNEALTVLRGYIEDVKSIESRRDRIYKTKNELKKYMDENDLNKKKLEYLKNETKNLTILSIENERKKNEVKEIQQRYELYKGIKQELLNLYKNVEIYNLLNNQEKSVLEKLGKLQLEKDELKKIYDEKYEIFINSAVIMVAKTLQEGVECPVCGSMQHPKPIKIKGNIPTKEELADFRNQKEKKEKEINKLKDDRLNLNKSLTENKSNIENIFKKLVTDSIFNINDDIYKYKEVITPKGQKVANELSEIEKKLNTLIKEVENLTKKVKDLDEKNLSIDKYEKLVEHSNKIVNDLEKKIAREEESLNSILIKVPSYYHNIKILSEKINIFEEEIYKIEENIKKTRKLYDETKIEIEKNKEKLSSLIKSVSKVNKKVGDFSSKLNDFIKENFEDIDEYNKSKLSKEELKSIKTQIEQYDQLVSTINKIINDLNEELKNIEVADVEKLSKEKEELKQKIEEQFKIINDINRDIKDNKKILYEIESEYNSIKDKENEYKVVAELSRLANGTTQNKVTLETFVLASYFEDVIIEANKRLEKITNNQYYLLRKDEVGGKGKKGLELDVYDTYTCKPRSVSSLSGGETFKVSLALALGLSDVVQHNAGGVQLDTMFIDEGFGTLDSESLDHAIDILIELQDNGRLVGVISHVDELKERIPVKLVVEKTPQGSTAEFRN